VHEDFSSRAAFNRHGGIDAAPAEAQVADLPRKEDAVGWEETDLRDTSTTESRVTRAIVVRVGMLSHVY